jgi:hypothetical protein
VLSTERMKVIHITYRSMLDDQPVNMNVLMPSDLSLSYKSIMVSLVKMSNAAETLPPSRTQQPLS